MLLLLLAKKQMAVLWLSHQPQTMLAQAQHTHTHSHTRKHIRLFSCVLLLGACHVLTPSFCRLLLAKVLIFQSHKIKNTFLITNRGTRVPKKYATILSLATRRRPPAYPAVYFPCVYLICICMCECMSSCLILLL